MDVSAHGSTAANGKVASPADEHRGERQRGLPPPYRETGGPAAIRHRRLGRRRQEHADRAPAVRLQAGLLRPARARRSGERAARARLPRPVAAHRRAARRARAGHHDRRRLPLFRDRATALHHRRHTRARAVHAQHGHRRLDRRPRDRAGGRPQGRGRAVQAPRLHQLAARHPARRRVRQQDGPGRLRRGRVRLDRRGLRQLRGAPRAARRDLHPDLRAAGRQRRRAFADDAVVPGPAAALPPRARAHRLRPQPDRRALPGAVGDPAARHRARRPTTAPTPARSPAGSCARATRCVVLPGGQHTTIAGIDTFEGPIAEAFPPMSVALRLRDDIDVGRGSTIVRPHNQPTCRPTLRGARSAGCPSSRSRGPALPASSTRRAPSTSASAEVRYRIDVETLHRDESADTLGLNDLGRVQLQLSAPLVFDSYRRNRVTGSLILIDEATNETVAAGVILDTEVEVEVESKTERSPNVSWQGTRMTRERRWRALGHSGRDAVVHRAAGRRQVDGRLGRRGAADRGRAAGLHARRRQPAPRPQRRPRLRRGTRGARTCAAPRTSRGCWPSPARSCWSASSARTRPTAKRPPRCTRTDELAVPRGVRRRAARAVRAARPEGPLRAGPCG